MWHSRVCVQEIAQVAIRFVMSRASDSGNRSRSPPQRLNVFLESRHRDFEYEAKGKWSKFDEDTMTILNNFHKEYERTWQPVFTVTINETDYQIDFQFFKQTNVSTGHERRIRLILY